jgi:putative transposase
MSFLSVSIHLVWATKNRVPFLTDNIRATVFKHIKENALKKGILIDEVNGYLDHMHCLVSLKRDQTISRIVQLIKGESSHWINLHNLCNNLFDWQNDYYGASVSPSQLELIRNYIRNQEEHHKSKTFQQECEEWMKYFSSKE